MKTQDVEEQFTRHVDIQVLESSDTLVRAIRGKIEPLDGIKLKLPSREPIRPPLDWDSDSR